MTYPILGYNPIITSKERPPEVAVWAGGSDDIGLLGFQGGAKMLKQGQNRQIYVQNVRYFER